jgi:hypothetical protein
LRNLLYCVALVGALALLHAGSPARADNEQLTVTQDEASMERVIEAFLKDSHQLVVNEKWSDDKTDLWLELPFGGDTPPAYRITIDTQSLNKDEKTGVIAERGVIANVYTGVKVPEDKRAAALVVINDFNRHKVLSSTYLDTDGEIVVCWVLNVMSQGLATEYVFDTVARLDKLWRDLYPLISPVLQ